MKLDFDKANSLAVSSIYSWLEDALDGKEKGRELWMTNPLRNDDEHATNFSINLDTGLWHDFATGDSGNALQLYSKLYNLNISDSAKHFLDHEGEYESAKKIDTSSIDYMINSMKAPPVECDGKWLYDDGNGFLFWIVRKNLPDGKKEIRPWYFDGTTWQCKKPEKPSQGFPLFNQHLIKSFQTIYMVEGEKTASAFPDDLLAVTWVGGAANVKQTNYAQLKGKNVILWPDNDEAGTRAMQEVKEILQKIGCSISMISPQAHWIPKADAADFTHDEIREIIKTAQTISEPKKSLFKLTRYGDMTLEPADWLIKGILENDSLACIFGQSGHGKSYVTLDMAACIASGKDYHGYKVKKSGAVVYIAGEGRKGIAKRLRAWEIKHETSLKDAPLVISHRPARLCEEESVAYVSEAIRQAGELYGDIRLIIFDTWARNMAGNENDTADTVQAINAVDELRKLYDCTAIIVHHSGKADSENGRGSSALRATLDVEYKVSIKDNNIVTLQNTKMKDGEPPEPIYFALNYVDLGILDEDGCSVESSAMEKVDMSSVIKSEKEVKKGKVADKILSIFKAQNTQELPEDVLRELATSDGMSRQSYFNAKKRLCEGGFLELKEGIAYLKTEP